MGLRWAVFMLGLSVAGGTPAWAFLLTGASPFWAMWPLTAIGILDLAIWAAICVRARLRERKED